MAAKLEKLLRIFAYLMGKDYFCIRFYTMGFRSSVGLEQQPSKLWVLGSNPNGITPTIAEDRHAIGVSVLSLKRHCKAKKDEA